MVLAVVSGDGADSEIGNTISWSSVAEATEYLVYWSSTPGVTETSTLLTTAAQGARSATHTGSDILAGGTYYYGVLARGSGGDSPLSAEVSGVPQQSITGNGLNDVAWNGADRLVAVGDAGIILTTPNGTTDGWEDVSTVTTPQALSAITWENVNYQFLIVGAGGTVLRGDGSSWAEVELDNIDGAVNLNDVAWATNRYIAVGNGGSILSSNSDGSNWTAVESGIGNTSLNAISANGPQLVVVGTNGTILNSEDGENWVALPSPTNNDLNDITWDGTEFTVVGSNDTILTSSDGTEWVAHSPGTSDINFVGVTQWDSGIPLDPVVVAVGSSGTYVRNPSNDPGTIIPTGTNEQLGAVTLVDAGTDEPYLCIVGNDGTVLTTFQR